MDSYVLNIVLLILLVVLAILLFFRHKQVQKLSPLNNLEEVLQGLSSNLMISRTDGKIQKVASQLSQILINYLKADCILFYRCQKRYMEMNYVYGLKNIQRSRYRIPLTNALIQKLISGKPLRHLDEFNDLFDGELWDLLSSNKFNLLFPIFWQHNLFGAYFIKTKLSIDNPLINLFLQFLNQNLSITYQLNRLESTNKILENKSRKNQGSILATAKNMNQSSSADDPGHLIEMFSHRKVDDLMAKVFEKIKTGLKAEKLSFISISDKAPSGQLKYNLGLNDDNGFNIDSTEFSRLYGSLQKMHVYGIENLREIKDLPGIKAKLAACKFDYLSSFSLDEKEPGLLFWSGKIKNDKSEYRLLSQLEHVARRAMDNAVVFEKYEEMSYTDSLTGLYNYRYFRKRLVEEIQRAKRYNRKTGLLLFDIDGFKMYNDNYGHQWGDELLRGMGDALARSLRAIDIISRYGGDEFCIIMPEADKLTCGIFMDRLRHSISSFDFRNKSNGFEGKITISIGGAIYPDDTITAEKLIYCSDMALLYSKNNGRNRGTLFSKDILAQNNKT